LYFDGHDHEQADWTMDKLTPSDWLSPTDQVMHGIERDANLRMSSSGFLMLKSVPDVERLRHRVDLLSRVVPRLRQVVVKATVPGPPRFVPSKTFALKHHYREIGAPGDGSFEALLEFISSEHGKAFDPTRPPWEFTLITGLNSSSAPACFYMRIHHAVTDGVGGIKMLSTLFDLEAAAEEGELPEAPELAGPSPAQLNVGAFVQARREDVGAIKSGLGLAVQAVRRPVDTANYAAELIGSVARNYAPTALKSPLLVDRSHQIQLNVITVQLDQLKAASHAVGGKLNDSFLAGLSQGLRLYHDHHGVVLPAVRLQMLVNQRTDDGKAAGNNWAAVRVELPIDIKDPRETIRAAHEIANRAKAEKATGAFGAIAGVASRMPSAVLTTVYRGQSMASDGAASNLPGIPVRVWVAGAEVDRYVAIGPLGGLPFNVTALSYTNQVNLSVQTDTGAISDGEVFIECLQAGFDAVIAVGTQGADG
jgi:WS/DGAT/MGAT family acyltransferase